MPAVCRFYLKGNCRFGRNCRFEHPGEDNKSSGFSFTKALEETSKPTNFSFTKALEETTNSSYTFSQQPQRQFFSSTPYHFDRVQQQQQHIGYNNPYNQSGFFNQTFQPQQYNNTFSNFSFAAASQDQTQRYNSFGNFDTAPHYPGQFNNQCIDEIDMRLPGEQQTQSENTDLTELELRAYESDKFQFRLIPIRPPPRHLCF